MVCLVIVSQSRLMVSLKDLEKSKYQFFWMIQTLVVSTWKIWNHSWIEVEIAWLVDARYRAAKFVRNQCCVVLSNEWERTHKNQRMPSSLTSHGRSWRTCSSLLASTRKHLVLMAILKRTIVIILLNMMQRMCDCQVSMKLNQSCCSVMEVWLRIGCARRTRVSLASSNRVCRQFRESLEEKQALAARLLATPRRKSTSIKLITTTAGVPPQDLLHKLRWAQLWLSRSKKNFRLQRRRRCGGAWKTLKSQLRPVHLC